MVPTYGKKKKKPCLTKELSGLVGRQDVAHEKEKERVKDTQHHRKGSVCPVIPPGPVPGRTEAALPLLPGIAIHSVPLPSPEAHSWADIHPEKRTSVSDTPRIHALGGGTPAGVHAA